jgi:tryptophan-rich sensory protein
MDTLPAFEDTPRRHGLGIPALLFFVAATAGVAWLGSLATGQSVESDWLASLNKPAFYPPDAAFGIVWTILYMLIAVSGWLAWRSGGGRGVLVPWILQLALNLGWTLAFFGSRNPELAMLVIIALLGVAIWTALAMRPVSRSAALMFLPYILWVGFASVLNWSIVRLN